MTILLLALLAATLASALAEHLIAGPRRTRQDAADDAEPEWTAALRRFLVSPDREQLDALAWALDAGGARAGVAGEVRALLNALVTGRTGLAITRGAVLERRLVAAGRTREALAVHLLRNEAVIQQAESFRSVPAGAQPAVLQAGIEACESCVRAARRLRDDACAAAYLSRLGNGLATLEQPRNAVLAFRQALALWAPLAASQPERYLARVGDDLTHLANALEAAGEPAAALRAFHDAVRAFRELHRRAPEAARLGLAMALCDGALLRRRRGAHASARKMWAEALRLLDGARDPTGRRFIPFTRAQVLHNWVLALWSTRDARFTGSDDDAWRAAVQAASIIADAAGPPATGDVLDLSIRARVLCAEVLARVGRAAEARAALSGAEADAGRLGSPLHHAEVLCARIAVEQLATGDPAIESGVHDRALAALERGLAALVPGEERLARQYKAAGEVLYAARLPRAVADGDHELAFGLLEALRRVERLALAAPPLAGGTLSQARQWLARWNATLLYVQVVPGGAVFVAVPPTGAMLAERAATTWRRRFDGLFHELNAVIHEAGESGDPIGVLERRATRLRSAGRRLFLELPDGVRELLQDPERQIFLSSYADLQNFPFELLRVDGGEWLGLRKVLPRVHSFHELCHAGARQPEPGAPPSAALFADPCGDLYGARYLARVAGPLLRFHGIELVPAGEPVLGDAATAARFRGALDQGVVLGIFCGHGGYDERRGSGYAEFAGNTRLWPAELGRLSLARHPILYFDCCDAGITGYAAGGRYLGMATGALDAGASACLVSNRVVFDDFAAVMAEHLLHALVEERRTTGEALLAARRKIAEECANPLAWAFPILFGNPRAALPGP